MTCSYPGGTHKNVGTVNNLIVAVKLMNRGEVGGEGEERGMS